MCSDEEFWSSRIKLKPPDAYAVLPIYGFVFSTPVLSSVKGCMAPVRSGELPMVGATEQQEPAPPLTMTCSSTPSLGHRCTGGALRCIQAQWMAALLHLLLMVCFFSNSMYMQMCAFTLYYVCTGMSYWQQQVPDMCRSSAPEVMLTSSGSRYHSSIIKLSLLLCYVATVSSGNLPTAAAAVRPATPLSINTFIPVLTFKAPAPTFNCMQRLTSIIFIYVPVEWMCLSSCTLKYLVKFLKKHHICIEYLDTLFQSSSRHSINLNVILVNCFIEHM